LPRLDLFECRLSSVDGVILSISVGFVNRLIGQIKARGVVEYKIQKRLGLENQNQLKIKEN